MSAYGEVLVTPLFFGTPEIGKGVEHAQAIRVETAVPGGIDIGKTRCRILALDLSFHPTHLTQRGRYQRIKKLPLAANSSGIGVLS